MILPTFEEFSQTALQSGPGEVLIRDWEPNIELGVHEHPFTVDALVVRGEMWLTVGHKVQHLTVGDTFHLDAQTPHQEKYGPMGATFWVKRSLAVR
jgi:mannose-6-phosphate isomerase-like protein (cupin superfamily)